MPSSRPSPPPQAIVENIEGEMKEEELDQVLRFGAKACLRGAQLQRDAARRSFSTSRARIPTLLSTPTT